MMYRSSAVCDADLSLVDEVDSVFFYMQKKAYEVRIIDWSSDVCSSDLIERLALPVEVRERAHRLLERGLGIDAVRIEDVDIIEPHPLEALVAARDQIFAAAADIAVRAGPHIPPRLGRDHQFVAVRGEIGREAAAERSEGHTSEIQSLLRTTSAGYE